MPEKRKIPSIRDFYAHFAHVLTRLQFIEQDAKDHSGLALHFLRQLNEMFGEAQHLRAGAGILPESLRLDSEAYLLLISGHISAIYSRGWAAVRQSTGVEAPGIGGHWNRFKSTDLKESPNLTLFAALIRQFLNRYRVPIEVHALKLGSLTANSYYDLEFLEVGWPDSELTRGIAAAPLQVSGSQTVPTPQEQPDRRELISKAEVAKRFKNHTGYSHTIAYKRIAAAVENDELMEYPYAIGRSNNSFREWEVMDWLKKQPRNGRH